MNRSEHKWAWLSAERVYCTETKRASAALLLICFFICLCNSLKGWCPLKCLPDFVVLRGLCSYEGCSDRCCCYEIPEVKGQGSSNSEGLQCFVPEKSNVTGFPEPILAFYDSELMENYIICFPKHIRYSNKGSVCFRLLFWQGRECRSPLKGLQSTYIHTSMCKQPKPKSFKKLFIENSVPITWVGRS